MAENKSWVQSAALTAALAASSLPGCAPNEKPAPANKPRAAAVASDTPREVIQERESESLLANVKSAVFYNGTESSEDIMLGSAARKAMENADFVAVVHNGDPDNNWKSLLKKREGKVTAATINIVGLENDPQAVLAKAKEAVEAGFNGVRLIADNKWTGTNKDREKHEAFGELMDEIRKQNPGVAIAVDGVLDASYSLNGKVDALTGEGLQGQIAEKGKGLDTYLTKRVGRFVENGGAFIAVEKTADPEQAAAASKYWKDLGAVPYIAADENLQTVSPNQPGKGAGVVPGGVQ